jgi:hypothetical protein
MRKGEYKKISPCGRNDRPSGICRGVVEGAARPQPHPSHLLIQTCHFEGAKRLRNL